MSFQERIYIEYRESNVLKDAFSVQLASSDSTFGIKNYTTNEIVEPSGTDVDNPSTGVYEFTFTATENTIYLVSWKVISEDGSPPRYLLQQVGPVTSGGTIRAITDYRGTFAQNTRGTLFLRITNVNGNATDADTISVSITDKNGHPVQDGFTSRDIIDKPAEKINEGYYAFDWNVKGSQTPGEYTVNWQYTIKEETRYVIQQVVVAENVPDIFGSLYYGRVREIRESLQYMLQYAQMIPVYREQAKKSRDLQTYEFSFPRWNQTPGSQIYLNDEIVTSGFCINYNNGTVTFDSPLTAYDRVEAGYTFRWFTDEQLDRFLSNSTSVLNSYPAVTNYNLRTIDDRFIPHVLYGAAVDALRYLMLSLQFTEPQLVFGGPDLASKAYSNFDTLKKNYENTWLKLLENKKNAPYKGLTRTVLVPSFALPGGRSRWFRYLFSSGS